MRLGVDHVELDVGCLEQIEIHVDLVSRVVVVFASFGGGQLVEVRARADLAQRIELLVIARMMGREMLVEIRRVVGILDAHLAALAVHVVPVDDFPADAEEAEIFPHDARR